MPRQTAAEWQGSVGEAAFHFHSIWDDIQYGKNQRMKSAESAGLGTHVYRHELLKTSRIREMCSVGRNRSKILFKSSISSPYNHVLECKCSPLPPVSLKDLPSIQNTRPCVT